MDPQHANPKRIVAAGYDRIAEQYCVWASQVRREERAKYTSLLLDKLPMGAAVLELGCGAGLPTTHQLAQRCIVTGVDISARQVALARHNVPTATFVHADMTQLDFAPASFDAVAAFYSLFRLVGALEGKSVLDLACGFGFYTRQLRQRGAAQVVGVDISPEMVRLAHARESEAPNGIEYRLGDATCLPQIGCFDLVTAVYLLDYATSKEQLLGMFQGAYDNLVAGGRFIAYTMDPAFALEKPNYTKYGVTVLRQVPEEDRYVCDAEFVTKPPTPFRYLQWSQATYEWAILAAGFSSFTWHPTEVAPEDVARYGEAYWQDLYTNGFIIGLVCHK